MRFIRKHGRIIPIREDKNSYKKGYTATGTLAGAGITAIAASGAALQTGLKKSLFNIIKGINPRSFSQLFGGKGRLGGGLLGGGLALTTASKVNAAYRTYKAPKGKRMEEAAKHTAAMAIGYKIGSVAAIPFQVHQIKAGVEGIVSAHYMRPVEISYSAIGKVAARSVSKGFNKVLGLGSGGYKKLTK